ncbi:MAG: PilZ domain-containing protein [Deltaproteobacteria bacterium]|nr:PilZ domain-containing protein [Deltaproteobacteria bacterium]
MERKHERRRRTRARLEVEAREVVPRGEAPVQARDISELGIRYEQSAFAPRMDGDQVLLQFHLPGDPEPIEVEAMIADERCLARTSETRATFLWPRAADARRIREYVAAHGDGGKPDRT